MMVYLVLQILNNSIPYFLKTKIIYKLNKKISLSSSLNKLKMLLSLNSKNKNSSSEICSQLTNWSSISEFQPAGG